MSRAVSIAILSCMALGLAACGEEGTSTAELQSQPPAAEAGGPPARPPGPTRTQSGAEAAKRPEPSLTAPGGPPPRELGVEDLIRGSGTIAREGDELKVHFTAIRFNGEFFESIWDQPFDFTLDLEDVNPGWVRGLPGMRAGGRRELVVPTQLTSRFGISPSENDAENGLIYVVDLLDVEARRGRERTEPVVSAPAGAPPKTLVVEDLIDGKGAAAANGDELTVEYVGVYWSGAPFSNSWERDEPFSFELGGRDLVVNPGWEKGLVGMRVGGRRKLIVPPSFLQPGGALPSSKPEDTLVYVIDLVGLQ